MTAAATRGLMCGATRSLYAVLSTYYPTHAQATRQRTRRNLAGTPSRPLYHPRPHQARDTNRLSLAASLRP